MGLAQLDAVLLQLHLDVGNAPAKLEADGRGQMVDEVRSHGLTVDLDRVASLVPLTKQMVAG